MVECDGGPSGSVTVNTCTLGLVPGTPVIGLMAFDAAPGHLPVRRFEAHHFLLPESAGPVRLRHRRDGRQMALELGPGDMVVTPAGAEAGFGWDEPFSATSLWIDGDGIAAFARREMGVATDGSDFEGEVVLRDPEIAAAVFSIRSALSTEGAGQNLIFNSLARVFLALLVRRHGRLSDPDAASFGGARLADLRAHVAATLHGSPHVEDMARAVGMSRTAFGRALRAATGLSPMAFVREARIERAKLLLGGEDTLGEIAARCGFADQAHFGRSFKAATGLTPRAWRMAGRAGSSEVASGTGPAPERDQSASCAA